MKVVAISGSPRIGGNSDILCDEFLKGAKEKGNEIAKINLASSNIHPCIACYGCKGDGKCVIEDDMTKILEILIEADVILLATPVYFYSMDAQMKIMIDRSLARYQEIKNKKFYFAVTAADPNHEAMDATIGGLKGYTDCLPGAEVIDVLFGTGAWEKGDILKLPVLGQAYEMGKSISSQERK